jgi:tRNA/tmRNA/rRNA uracil-C5-methylase (TrmA/RlmC/RlmD family)
LPGATEVTVRCGTATGERLAVVEPAVPEGATGVPDDVQLVGTDELAARRRVWLHEEVAGRRFRVSATSFFQSRADGAAALVDAVHDAVDAADPARVVDLYAGVGLFAATFDAAVTVTAVEASASAVADAKVNLTGHARVVRADVRRWRPSPADAVVADPSRHGLGARVVHHIAGSGARKVALVSCDPGALGRDAGLLAGAGFQLDATSLVDLFPGTPHVEVVTAWARDPGRDPAP